MADAIECALSRGAERVMVLGADIPRLTDTIMGSAFKALHDNDVVYGPAQDGGYYLVGVSSRCRGLPLRMVASLAHTKTPEVANEMCGLHWSLWKITIADTVHGLETLCPLQELYGPGKEGM